MWSTYIMRVSYIVIEYKNKCTNYLHLGPLVCSTKRCMDASKNMQFSFIPNTSRTLTTPSSTQCAMVFYFNFKKQLTIPNCTFVSACI